MCKVFGSYVLGDRVGDGEIRGGVRCWEMNKWIYLRKFVYGNCVCV